MVFSTIYFADDTFLLNIQSKISKINKSLNKHLKELSFWLNTNKMSFNVAKTEVILSKTKHKSYDTASRLKLCRKILNRTSYVSYLGIKIDENLDWKIHIHDLNGVNSVLSKPRHFVCCKIIRSIYFAIFQSPVNCVHLAWGLYHQHKIFIL